MNRSYRIVPSYTGDVSGAASALFELGGMVVIHDPSGCNSTYNTHDETRWYDRDSLIFISGLSQMDACMGDDDKLIREIEEAARQLSPSFIALLSSPIPFMNGTDFPAIARILEKDLDIPAFFVQTNGMHDYIRGAGNAFAALAEKMVLPPGKIGEKSAEKLTEESSKKTAEVLTEESVKTSAGRKVNILGLTPLDFAFSGSEESIKGLLASAGWIVQSSWAMGDTLDRIRQAANADVNLVVSSTGLRAAKVLRKRFGIPYVVGCPIGSFAEKVLTDLEKSRQDRRNRISYSDKDTQNPGPESSVNPETEKKEQTEKKNQKRNPENSFIIIGEPVTANSLKRVVEALVGSKGRLVCPVEAEPELLLGEDLYCDGEEQIEKAIAGIPHLYADPLYSPIMSPDTELHPLPTLSLSGRCYRKEWKNLFEFEKDYYTGLIDRLEAENTLSDREYLQLLGDIPKEAENYLYERGRQVCQKVYGNEVFFRGLIEISSYCKNNCYYCGIRRGNEKAERYRLTFSRIMDCCRMGYDLGFRTFVLQGGEDAWFTDDRICEIVSAIKKAYPDCAVTLSIGEKEKESYQRYFDAGADRYLLRHETANEDHYGMLHPSELSGAHRKQCLYDLKEIGYQVGCGIMVGSPYQTGEHIIEDIRFMQKLGPHMIGIGPFIPHKDTPFATEEAGTLEDTVRLLAILRLTFPHCLLPATTALGTIDPQGREKGILAGANVVMPNLSPADVRGKYLLYDGKICTGDEAAEHRQNLVQRVERIGYHVSAGRGDYK